ncbi:MAG: hypothetical protein JWQ40_125 [Segetibacter sp.]|nr:hypothetical protein [Segetibacter sp.]
MTATYNITHYKLNLILIYIGRKHVLNIFELMLIIKVTLS